jgi:cysteine desulfurase / selenocysteine lyase
MFSAEFPLDPGLCYLNHAAVAPWPTRTTRAVQAFAEENNHTGSRHYERWLATERDLREGLRQLINATSTDEIALLKNTSEALSVVAHGLDWSADDEVVISHLEFPSNRIVWESLARYGVKLRIADLYSRDNPEQALLDCLTDRTRLLSVSSVQYGNGLRLDLPVLGKACRERNILFCVDAIQSIGTGPFDVQAIQADFVMADGHKWMLGPEGLALFYCRRERLESLRLNQFGWHMVAAVGDFDRKEWAPSPTATRFECGSPNLLCAHALHASIGLLLEVGMEQVAERIMTRTQRIIDFIQDAPERYRLITDPTPARRAGIVTFKPLREDLDALYRRLQAAGVICAQRGGGIRFSPHFHTRPDEIDRALALVAND